jgi:hypothetical protein
MICHRCGIDKPASEFGRTTKGWTNPCRECERDRAQIRKHGLTAAQKNLIAERQGGCAICGHPEPSERGWHVDHDHACCDGETSCPGCRRGIVCAWCNQLLRLAFDRPHILLSAAEYLRSHAIGTCDWHKPIACAPGICDPQMQNTDGRTDQRRSASPSEKSCVGKRAQGGIKR